MAEFKQEIAYRKSRIKEGLGKCPIEINAIDSVTPEAPDYEALEAEKVRLSAELEEVETAITDVAETAANTTKGCRENAKRLTTFGTSSKI